MIIDIEELHRLKETDIKKKICPINGAPCCECVPGAYCAVEVKNGRKENDR